MIVVEVTGVDELLTGLRRLDDYMEEVGHDSAAFAADVTVTVARPTVPVLTGAAAGSLETVDYSDGAGAVGGSDAVPYYGWLEFGGDAGRNRSVHRPTVPDGRYLHPAYLRNFDKIEQKMADRLEEAIRDAGLK